MLRPWAIRQRDNEQTERRKNRLELYKFEAKRNEATIHRFLKEEPMKKGKLAAVNAFVGFFSQIVILTLGLIVPKVIISNYGSDTNGLTNTITQIFSYIALLEAGITQSVQNALYPRFQRDDKQGVSVLMSAGRRYNRRVSIYYGVAVMAAAVLLPFTLKTEVDFWTIFFYVFFEGLTSVVGFYFTGLWVVFLNTAGKTYLTNAVSLVCKVLQYGTKLVLALFGVNILFVQIGYFLVSLLSLLIYGLYMRNKYSWIDYKAADKFFKLPDRNAYIVTEVASAIFSSTDMIVLSIMVSTSLSSVYSVYNMIFLALNSLINGVYTAIKYTLGHAYSQDMGRYKKLHDAFNSLFVGIMTVCMCVCMWVTLPFIRLYTSGVEDINYIYEWLPFWFCLVQMLSMSRYVAGNLSGIAGYAKPVSIASLAEAITNVVGTVLLVYFFSIYGAIIATVIALPIKVIYVNYIAEKKIMKRKPTKTLLILAINYAIFGATVAGCQFYKPSINSYLEFIVWGVILFVSYALVTFGLNALVNRDLLFPIRMAIEKKRGRKNEQC